MRLNESEERELIRRAKAGDDGARNRLWEAFFLFAVAECRRQAELMNLDPDIAEGEAALAIPEAIERFDLRRHSRFSTYLTHRLRGAVTAAMREHRRSSIFDTADYHPDKAEEPAEWSEIQPRSAGDFWPPQVVRWARRRRRRNDRMIVKWLWLDRQPKTQAEIARRLGISRSAVCQRRRKLMKSILLIAPNVPFDQDLGLKSLNTEEDEFYIWSVTDLRCGWSLLRPRSYQKIGFTQAEPSIARTNAVQRVSCLQPPFLLAPEYPPTREAVFMYSSPHG